MKLMIVESPGKTKKIQGFLGSGWKVMASVGHVRDLPDKGLGVKAPDFRPQYEVTSRGGEVLARLKTAAQAADEVYLATDPDREGEAIAWHLQDALGLKKAKRVTFTEITGKAVSAALEKPRAIDMALVAAQEGRRVVDRLCGYLVSGPLSDCAALGRVLSAGRVQSPAVRLVVDRERAIKNFVSTTHYGVDLRFEAVANITDGWKASWKPWLEEGREYFLDKATAERVAAIRSLEVLFCEESESRSAPPAPFITSSLQQAASNALKFAPKKTMELAQKLYEGGHVTYLRTDSPYLSEDFVREARAYCQAKGLPLVEKPRTWKAKGNAQEAHEAIRPTHVEVEEAGETEEERDLYRLIRLRTLACMLADAVYAARLLSLGGSLDGKTAVFEARGRVLLSGGWRHLVASDQADEEEAQEPENPVPALKSGDKALAQEGVVVTRQTKPPKRFTEATLIRELEKRGIGRPATYAAILDGIINKRGYLALEKRFLAPTPDGAAVVDHLKGNFSFLEFEYTKRLEDTLDEIAAGRAAYMESVAAVFDHLQAELDRFKAATAAPCPECGAPLRHLIKKAGKDSKGYDFFACKACDSTFFNDKGKPGGKQEKRERKPQVLSAYKCMACHKPLARRQGRVKDTGEEYDFYGCSGYPGCRQTYETTEDGKPDYDSVK
ncbi:MAG: type I DNA topoisomerase [Desulfovibrio sp.]|jgi:DNA topoisomerase-1|nr:type I DNA topoisomerase [Desulfovibrio sp.]